MATQTLHPALDARIISVGPDTNYGTLATFSVGATAAGRIDRAFIKQGDWSGLPANALITKGTFRLAVSAYVGGASQTLTLRRVLRDWGETTVTYNKYDGTNAWQTAGCNGALDRDSTILWTGAVAGASSDTFVDFTNDAITALVKAWYEGTTPDYGLLITSASEGGGIAEALTFRSSEHTDATYTPQLVVEYWVPKTVTAYDLTAATDADGGVTLTAVDTSGKTVKEHLWYQGTKVIGTTRHAECYIPHGVSAGTYTAYARYVDGTLSAQKGAVVIASGDVTQTTALLSGSSSATGTAMTNSGGKWWEYDLGSVKNIGRVQVALAGMPQYYRVWVKEDNEWRLRGQVTTWPQALPTGDHTKHANVPDTLLYMYSYGLLYYSTGIEHLNRSITTNVTTSGAWTTQSKSWHSPLGGTAKKSSTAGDTIHYTFTGKHVSVFPVCNVAAQTVFDVAIDGVFWKQVTLQQTGATVYLPSAAVSRTNLTDEAHTITLTVVSGTLIVDHFSQPTLSAEAMRQGLLWLDTNGNVVDRVFNGAVVRPFTSPRYNQDRASMDDFDSIDPTSGYPWLRDEWLQAVDDTVAWGIEQGLPSQQFTIFPEWQLLDTSASAWGSLSLAEIQELNTNHDAGISEALADVTLDVINEPTHLTTVLKYWHILWETWIAPFANLRMGGLMQVAERDTAEWGYARQLTSDYKTWAEARGQASMANVIDTDASLWESTASQRFAMPQYFFDGAENQVTPAITGTHNPRHFLNTATWERGGTARGRNPEMHPYYYTTTSGGLIDSRTSLDFGYATLASAEWDGWLGQGVFVYMDAVLPAVYQATDPKVRAFYDAYCATLTRRAGKSRVANRYIGMAESGQEMPIGDLACVGQYVRIEFQSATQTQPGTMAVYEYPGSLVPDPPSGCTVTGDLASRTVLWTDEATTEDYYEIERSVDGGDWSALSTTLPADTSYYLDSEALPDGTLTVQYRVRCRNAAGTSTYATSDMLTFITSHPFYYRTFVC